ncbi:MULTISPECIES: hypothetical protein [unclassified Xanthobacter]|uniref:hypothetical protein n=2 Tax=Xanthobacter TaxID=279 RepID=UPI001F2C8011|nr:MULTISPECIES: hypothetical protein [unclassified Xanthobacter]
MKMGQIRWRAVVHYRTDAGVLDVEHFLEELGDIHDRVEAGPHWDTIERIEILRHGVGTLPGLTVEAAEKL